MPVKAIPFIYAGIFAVILINIVPRKEIRRLFIYGLIFGGIFDIIVVGLGNLLGEFKYINYEPYGLLGIHIMAPISWSIYFIIYFYLLPKKKLYLYIYVTVAFYYSILFCQMLAKLGVITLNHGIIDSTVPFLIWYPTATWGYYRLTKNDSRLQDT